MSKARRTPGSASLSSLLGGAAKFGRGLAVLVVATSTWAGPAATAHASPPTPAADTETDAELVLIRVVSVDLDPRDVRARLRAELGVLGLESAPLELDADAPPLASELLARVDAAGASAAIEIVITEAHIDVWVADANTGKTLTRRFNLILDPEQAEARTLALAAVELLRASRLELEQRADPSEPEDRDPATQISENERPPEPEETTRTRRLTGALSVAPILGGSPGGFGLTTHIELAGRWTPLPRFGLRAAIWLPILGNRYGDYRGQSRLTTALIFVEPQLRLPGGAPWFHPVLGLGAGAAILVIQTQPAMGFGNRDEIHVGFAGHAHAGFGFALAPRVWLRLDAYVGIVQPQPRVLFAEYVDQDGEQVIVSEVVAEWGLPFGAGSAGLEFWF